MRGSDLVGSCHAERGLDHAPVSHTSMDSRRKDYTSFKRWTKAGGEERMPPGGEESRVGEQHLHTQDNTNGAYIDVAKPSTVVAASIYKQI